MKISKLFHWLYTILMFIPFVAVLFNFVRIGLNGSMPLTDFGDVLTLVKFPTFTGVSYETLYYVYEYLVTTIFGLENSVAEFIINCLTYWTTISIIYLIFDVVMYVPLLVHRWLDKGVLE